MPSGTWPRAGAALGAGDQVATKWRPSAPRNAGSVEPSTTLLVRRAEPEGLDQLLALLGTSGEPEHELARLARNRGVFVLSDVASPPGTPPLAAVALEIDRRRRVAQIVAIAVSGSLRRRGLGRRLLGGTTVWLRAEGVERLEATVSPFGTIAAFLGAAGFEVQDGDDDSSPACTLVQWL